MKKFIAYVVFVFIVGFSAYFIYGTIQSSQYDGTAIPYIHKVLPEISTWNPETVRQYMAPEILKNVSAEDLQGLLDVLAKMGELQKIGKVKFTNKSTGDNVQLAKGSVVTYDIDAQYSSGDAKVTISLLERDGSYEIYHFNFKSRALPK